jgi:hypothetical protein
VLPPQLMTLTIETCQISKSEIVKRMQFAARFETKSAVSNAITHYPSWYRMTKDGLVESKRQPMKKKPARVIPFLRLRTMRKEVDRAVAHHLVLTRAEVNEIERLIETLQRLLQQIDENDTAKVASHA